MGRGANRQETLTLGYIAGAHGVKGWVRVNSYTEPREAILKYRPWLLGDERQPAKLLDGRRQGKSVIAHLEGVGDRDQAEALRGLEIGVDRSQLPDAGEDQYYWADLIGLEVLLEDGQKLGCITQMMATGANDVMVVKGDRERLIPFVTGTTVTEVNLETRQVIVDWDADF